MGLSAYGNNKYENVLSELVTYKNCKYELNLKYFQHHKIEIQEINEDGEINYKDLFSHELEDLIKIKAQNQFVFSQTAADIAKSIQVIYENIFFSYLRDLQQKYDQTNLCLSGGCALNSLANGKNKK